MKIVREKGIQIKTKPKYTYIGEFCEGLACVQLNGKCGFIDKTGKEVIECKYDYVSDFHEGLARVKLKSNLDFIDKTRKVVIYFEF